MTVRIIPNKARLAMAALVAGASSIATACQPVPALDGPTVVIGDSLIEGYRRTGLQSSVAPNRQPVTVNATVGRRADQNLNLLRGDYGVRNAVNHAATVVIGDGTNISSGDYGTIKRAQLDTIFGINPDARVILLPLFAEKSRAVMDQQNSALYALANEYSQRGQNVMVASFNIPAGCLGADRVHPRGACYSQLQGQVAYAVNAPSSGTAPAVPDLVK